MNGIDTVIGLKKHLENRTGKTVEAVKRERANEIRVFWAQGNDLQMHIIKKSAIYKITKDEVDHIVGKILKIC